MDKEEYLLSFIIPAYNAEATIKNTIDSIITSCDEAKCDENIEIIIVLNGCTDNTLKIVEDIEDNYKIVRHISSDKGVSCARNTGIDAANGEWIVFVDADDGLTNNAINVLISDALRKECDLYAYGHYTGEISNPVTDGTREDIYKDEYMQDAIVHMLENPTRYMQVWAKLFSHKIVESYNIRFNESLSMAEDSDFTLRYVQRCRSVMFSSECIYKYSLNSNSAMRTFDGSKINRYIASMTETEKSIVETSCEIEVAFQIYILMHLNIAMVRETFDVNNKNTLRKKYAEMKRVISEDIFAAAIKKVPFNKCKSVRMLPTLFLKLKLKPLAAMMFSLRARQNYVKEKNANNRRDE